MPKVARASTAADSARHNPLAEDYSPVVRYKEKAAKKRKARQDEGTEESIIDTKASRKILSLGQDLVREAEQAQEARYVSGAIDGFAFESRLGFEDGIQSDEEGEEGQYGDEEEGWMDETEELDPNDLDMFHRFNPSSFTDPLLEAGGSAAAQGESRNLADIILAKIAEQEANQAGVVHEPHPLENEETVQMPAKVAEVYTKIGHILSRYRSGKLPKAFKIIPTLPPAMQASVVGLTRPDDWTPHAVYAATRIFVSAASVTAQQFVQAVLLDRVRQDIAENKKLNVHFYKAMEKSLYKPAAFFKGLLFPLLQGSCTLREAAIISSVITRVSVPVLHSAAALSRCCDIAAEQMAYHVDAAASTNLFIRALLEKRYALPYQTIDSLVFHFLRFSPQVKHDTANGSMDIHSTGRLPVIWHQCLLVFAQRYRNEISEEQREALLDLLLIRGHSAIGPEIRRELLAGRGRGVMLPPENGARPGMDDGDDTLMAAA